MDGRLSRLMRSMALRGFVAATVAAAALAIPQAAFPQTIAPAISASRHILALDTNGKVYAWGPDNYGQLGQGRTIVRPSPVRVADLPSISYISLEAHALAVDVTRRVWSWGDNICGQLGPRDATVASKPGRVIGLTNVIMAAAGNCYSLAVRSDGSVWGWGNVPGYGGESGLRQLAGLDGIVEVAAGGRHVIARRTDGTVYAFGQNQSGQLGLGTTDTPDHPYTATRVPGISGAASISAASDSSIVLLANGQIHAWGRIVTGTNFTGQVLTLPTLLPPIGSDVAQISASITGLHALGRDGVVRSYDPGSGTWNTFNFPGLPSVTRISVSFSFLGITASGQLYEWGTPVPGMGNTTMVKAGFPNGNALALKSDGSLWFWGFDSGLSGDGAAIVSSVPLAVAIPAKVKEAVAGVSNISVALDTGGTVWAWGQMSGIGTMLSPESWKDFRSVPSPLEGLANVRAVAVGCCFLALLKDDGSVQITGNLAPVGSSTEVPLSVPGFSSIVALAADNHALYALRSDGKLFAAGDLPGIGESATAVEVTGISGTVTRISAAGGRAGAVTSDGRVWMWGGTPLSSTPELVPGVTDAVDLSVGFILQLIKRRDGSVLAFGDVGLADGIGRPQPYPVSFPGGAVAVVAAPSSASGGEAASQLGFLVGEDGVAWGFGRYGTASSTNATIGDGTFVSRDHPVVIMAPGGAGSLDANDWYLDLDPSTTQTIPATSTPTTHAVAVASGSTQGLGLGATIRYRSADYGRRVNNYVLGLVPASFFGAVKSAPSLSPPSALAAKAEKSNGFVLAQLTPSGWTDVTGQLIAYSQGTANAAGNSASILNGVNVSGMPGARFCVGYGESSGSMLTYQSVGEVLALEGASAVVSGVPCVLSGIYMDGPPTSRAGTTVSFTASVVGLTPAGSVQFSDTGASLLSPVTLTATSAAVGRASLSTNTLKVGKHSIGAWYGGDARNVAMTTEIPLRHEVVSVTPGESRLILAGPSSSELFSQVVFTVTVTGDSPTGTVQFRDGVNALGGAVPLVGGLATLRAGNLAQGTHVITATYSGDNANAASTSNAINHAVYAAIATSISLATSANAVTTADAVRLTATVTGSSPTGTVTFRDGGAVLGTASVVNGAASLTVSSFDGGAHALTAEYSGDASNQAVTSTTVFLRVSVPGVLAANPSTLAFGGQSMNTTAPSQTVTFTNSGTSTVTVSSVIASTYFAVSHNCSSVAVGASCTATVNFTPTAQGTLDGTLTLATNAGVVTVGLSGTGEKSLTTHYYRSILRRAPDASGKAYWDSEAARAQALGIGVNEVWFAMAQSFFTSAEYQVLNRDNAGFVTDLYGTFFNRPPDAGGLAFWVDQLGQGLPREVALAGFMFSSEFGSFTQAIFGITATRKEIDTVVDFYRGMLGALPDDGGFRFWLQQFRAAQCQGGSAVNAQVESISSAFANSVQYANRGRSNSQYVGDLYNAFLRRGGDLGGVQFWIGEIATGARTRESVRQQFVGSPEFQARVAVIIAQGCVQ